MWKSAYVGVYQLLNWKMHGETLKLKQKHWNLNKCLFMYRIKIQKNGTYQQKIVYNKVCKPEAADMAIVINF